MKLILINGKKRSGKDYFAGELKKQLELQDYSVEIMSFAEPIKSIIAITLGISTGELELYKNNPEQYEIDTFDNEILIHKTNYREVLQQFSTEAMKPFFGKDVWVKMLLARAQDKQVDYILVPDFRFLVENIGDCTVRVNNFDLISTDLHESEIQLDKFKFDYQINNTGKPNLTLDINNFIKYLAKLN